MQEKKSTLISWIKFAIGWPLSIISIIFIIRFIYSQSTRVSINFQSIDIKFLLLGIFFFFIYFLMRSFLWQRLLIERGNKISFRENTYRFSVSEIKRYTPGNVWSFLSRAHLFNEVGIDKRTVGVSIIADIQLVIIGCSVVSLISIPWILNGGLELQNKLISLLPFSIILIIIYFLGTGILYKKKYDKNISFLSSLILPGFKLKSKIKISVIGVVTYAFFGIANFFVLLSLHSVSQNYFLILSSFFVFSLLVGYLTFITPVGLGVREIVVSLGLSQIMIPANAGAISIYTRIILVISEISFLVLILVWQKSSKK